MKVTQIHSSLNTLVPRGIYKELSEEFGMHTISIRKILTGESGEPKKDVDYKKIRTRAIELINLKNQEATSFIQSLIN